MKLVLCSDYKTLLCAGNPHLMPICRVVCAVAASFGRCSGHIFFVLHFYWPAVNNIVRVKGWAC